MESFRSHSVILRKPRVARGFSLVELLVTLSILLVITAIAITGQSTFNQTTLLTDTAYTVALSAREAQSLGLSSRKFAGVQNGGYGIHFNNGNPTKSYVIFADISANLPQPPGCTIVATTSPEQKAGNCVFDPSAVPPETFQSYDLTGGFTISDFCGKPSGGGAMECASTNTIQSLDVLYLRPNTTAIITGTTPGPGDAQRQYSCAEIYVKSPTSATTQTIRMSSLGEVSVAQKCP